MKLRAELLQLAYFTICFHYTAETTSLDGKAEEERRRRSMDSAIVQDEE